MKKSKGRLLTTHVALLALAVGEPVEHKPRLRRDGVSLDPRSRRTKARTKAKKKSARRSRRNNR